MKAARTWIWASLAATGAALMVAAGCGKGGENGANGSGETAVKGAASANLSGEIRIDGSSTVYPVSQAVAEEFNKLFRNVKVTVAESGTGGGFKKFAAGEIDICGASRPIDEKEIAACKEKGIEFVELPIAYDGLSVVVHPSNDWVDTLTVAELKKIWEPNSAVKKWSDVRAGFPDKEIKLFGAGADSGTFEYFTEAIVGKKKSSRSDYMQSEDDNQLVQGVAGEPSALGYFGLAYYIENEDKLKLVKIDSGSGGVAPSVETVKDGTYTPLSRPIFIYVTRAAMDRPEVAEFIKYYVGAEGQKLISSVGYVNLPDTAYQMAAKRVETKQTGSTFSGVHTSGKKVEDLMGSPAG